MTAGPPIPLSALLPELVLLVAGCVVLVLGQARRESWRLATPWATLAGLVIALGLVLIGPGWVEPGLGSRRVGSGLDCGSLAAFVRLSALQLGILLTLANWSQAGERERGEFLSMMLFSLVGLMLVGAAANLVILFLGLELVSIPTYVMVVLGRRNPRSLEAGTKYFYLGALSAAVMAYGFSFLYGVAGTAALFNSYDADGRLLSHGALESVARALQAPGTLEYGLAAIGIVLSVGGLLFKIAAVPLHFYVADVYQGAASPVAGFLGFVPKLAGLVAIFRIVLLTGQWKYGDTPVFWLLWIVAAASMCVGNVLALRQTNIKRLLGYSGIAHAGYMLVGVLAGPQAGKAVATEGVSVLGDGTAAVLYYVVIYGIANLAAFAILGLLRVRDRPCETLRDVAGLLRREPGLALVMVLAMFTLMGLPPTPGFWGKVGLFGSALTGARLAEAEHHSAWLIALVIIAVLNTALAAAYYLRVIAAILVHETEHPARAATGEAQHIGALLCGFLILIFMFYPSDLLARGRQATTELDQQLDSVPRESATLSPTSPADARLFPSAPEPPLAGPTRSPSLAKP